MPKNPNLNPKIEEAMKLEEVSSRMLLELHVEERLITDVSSLLDSQSFITREVINDVSFIIFRFVADETTDYVVQGNTYRSMSITRGALETTSDGKVARINIKIENKNLGFACELAKIGNKLNYQEVFLQEYFNDFPDQPPVYFFSGKLNRLKMTVSNFEFDVERILGSFNSDAPTETYGVNCPLEFGGIKCGVIKSNYPNTKCDHTLQSCDSFNNRLNFGGHPSISKEMVIK